MIRININKMRFLIISDTHFKTFSQFKEFIVRVEEKNGNDLKKIRLIMAGDIFDRVWNSEGYIKKYVYESMQILSRRFKKVYYVMGNHEYFRYKIEDEYIDMNVCFESFKSLCSLYRIELIYRKHFVFVDQDEKELEENDGYSYEMIGCTLWTNVNPDTYEGSTNQKYITNDCFSILSENNQDIEFLKQDNRKWWNDRNKKVRRIVITHHPPKIKCIPEELKHKDRYGNELNDSIFTGIDYWISGHIHSPHDSVNNGCRLILNPYIGDKDASKLTPYEF